MLADCQNSSNITLLEELPSVLLIAFSGLMLLVISKSIQPVKKLSNDVLACVVICLKLQVQWHLFDLQSD